MRLSYAMQRGIPAGQVAKGGSEAPCFYSRRVSAWVDMFGSYCLDLLSLEPVIRGRAQQGVRCLLLLSLFSSTFSVSSDADLLSSYN